MVKLHWLPGARQGLGRAIALGLAKAGADLLIADRVLKMASWLTSLRKLKRWAKRAVTSGGDISVEADVEAMVKKATAELGKVDILVNNAGVTAPDRFVDMPLRRWNLIINVNLTGTAYCAHAVLPQMVERNSGVIINMSSILALRVQQSIAYGTTKAAVERFTTGLVSRNAPEQHLHYRHASLLRQDRSRHRNFMDGRTDMTDW